MSASAPPHRAQSKKLNVVETVAAHCFALLCGAAVASFLVLTVLVTDSIV